MINFARELKELKSRLSIDQERGGSLMVKREFLQELIGHFEREGALLRSLSAAQPAEEVQPVAWRIPINGMYEFFNSEADAIAERKEYDGGDPPMFTPEALYTRPPAKS